MTTKEEPTEFIEMSAKYLVAPGSKPADLMNDTACLLASAISIMDAQDDMSQEMWGAFYLFRQAKGAFDAAHETLTSAGAFTAS